MFNNSIPGDMVAVYITFLTSFFVTNYLLHLCLTFRSYMYTIKEISSLRPVYQ